MCNMKRTNLNNLYIYNISVNVDSENNLHSWKPLDFAIWAKAEERHFFFLFDTEKEKFLRTWLCGTIQMGNELNQFTSSIVYEWKLLNVLKVEKIKYLRMVWTSSWWWLKFVMKMYGWKLEVMKIRIHWTNLNLKVLSSIIGYSNMRASQDNKDYLILKG
jgi:hypothetical protein